MTYQTSITFIVYFAIILTIGFVASRRTKNLSDYMLAGRGLSGPVAALGAGASDMSGWLLLGLPGAVYLLGISQIWMPIGLSIGAYLNWQFVAKRLRVYTEVVDDALTIPTYFDNRFQDGSGILRCVTALAIIVFFVFYTSSGFVGGALLFQTTYHISYHIALWVGAAFICAYIGIGGFLAVNWTDFFQGTLMFFVLLTVPILVLHHMGGWQHTINVIGAIDAQDLDALHHISTITIVSLLVWGLGYFGQPHILVRFMATKSPKYIPQARFICMTWMIISLYGAVFTGFFGIAHFHNPNLANSETVFVDFAQELFNPWFAGIIIAAILSAIMSTISALLLASASAVTEDFYHKVLRKNARSRELLWVSRLTVVGIVIAAIVLAHDPNRSILALVAYAWGGLGGTFGPVVLFSLYWSRMTAKGAIAGICVGAIVSIIWNILDHHYGGIFKLYSIFPAFVLNAVSIIIISLVDKPPSTHIMTQFKEMQSRL